MRYIFLLFIIAAFTATALAQSPSKILSKAEKALGGRKAVTSVKSWKRVGTITKISNGASGSFLQISQAPDLFYTRYELDGFETEVGFNGRSAWVRDSRDGLRTLTGDPAVDLQTEARYRSQLWLNYKKDRAKITSGSRTEVNGRAANAVVMSTPRGASLKLFFDNETGLPVREEIPFGDATDIYEYSDHRKINGVAQPFEINAVIDGESYRIELSSVEASTSFSLSQFSFPETSGRPLPEIRSLLTQLQTNEDEVERILDTYSYVQKNTRRELGKDGILRETGSETNQLSFHRGNRISRQIEKNGKPLTSREQAEADKDTAKQIEEIEKRIAKEEKRSDDNPQRREARVSIAEVLRASRLINPRRERYKGREMIVFDFEPNPDFDMKNAKSVLKFFGKTAGVMWIDENDRQVARIEAFLADSYNIGGGLLAKLRKGASFTLEQERVNNEIWLPSLADINLSVRVLMFGGANVNQVVRSYDYQKFATEVEKADVNTEEKP
ncbi:MAG: hypothetical protein KF685_02980 [Acidobacteria bacterium]|nr:hypothetical protein [Acidobacteriota bacterium]